MAKVKTLWSAIEKIGEDKFYSILHDAIFEQMEKMSPQELREAFVMHPPMSAAERKNLME